jgi:signal peptidase I
VTRTTHRTTRRLIRLALIAIPLAAWAIWLRPTMLGGPAGYVVVAGDSMLPTFSDGTLVLTTASADYALGDVIAFAVATANRTDQPLVIHRIVSGDASEGFVTQGDNRTFTDPWIVRVEDIVGRSSLSVAGVGQVLLALRSPIALASIGAGIAAYVVLGWTAAPRKVREGSRRSGQALDIP